jgi:hypothetical protein
MGYRLVLLALSAPLTIDHGIAALGDTPFSGFFSEQSLWNAAEAEGQFDEPYEPSPDEREACAAADLPRLARLAAARQTGAEQSARGPLHDALLSAAGGDAAHLGHLQNDAAAQIHALAPRLELGDCLAFQEAEALWAIADRLRILSFDDAELLIAGTTSARAFCESGKDHRAPPQAADNVPCDDTIRRFVMRHAGQPCLLTKG